MMRILTRKRTRRILLAGALFGAPLLLTGCLGASDDREGSGLAAGTGGDVPNNGRGPMTQTQANREDKGDNNNPSTNLREELGKEKGDTGGLGTGSHTIPGKPEPKTPAEPEPPR